MQWVVYVDLNMRALLNTYVRSFRFVFISRSAYWYHANTHRGVLLRHRPTVYYISGYLPPMYIYIYKYGTFILMLVVFGWLTTEQITVI